MRKVTRYQDVKFKLQEDYYETIKALARDEEVSIGYMINEIIGSFLDAAKELQNDGEA